MLSKLGVPSPAVGEVLFTYRFHPNSEAARGFLGFIHWRIIKELQKNIRRKMLLKQFCISEESLNIFRSLVIVHANLS